MRSMAVRCTAGGVRLDAPFEFHQLGIELSAEARRLSFVEFQRCEELLSRRGKVADFHSALQPAMRFLMD